MTKTNYGWLFRICRQLVSWFLPRYSYSLPGDLDLSRPTVFVSHHQNMYGPVAVLASLSPQIDFRTWVFDVFFDQEACYNHYVDFTFTERFGWPKSLSKLAAWPLSYFVSSLIRSAKAIPVYRESRKIITTMKESVAILNQGSHLLIFPDMDYSSDTDKTGEIYEGFLHLDKYFSREFNSHLQFVPILADKEVKRLEFGQAIEFPGESSFIEERPKVAEAIRQQLNELAKRN